MKELSSNSIWCFLQLQQSPRELEQAFPAQYLGFLPFTANCALQAGFLSYIALPPPLEEVSGEGPAACWRRGQVSTLSSRQYASASSAG